MSILHSVLTHVLLTGLSNGYHVALLKKQQGFLLIQPMDLLKMEGPDRSLVEKFAAKLEGSLPPFLRNNSAVHDLRIMLLVETFTEHFLALTPERPDPIYRIKVTWA